MTKAMAVFAVLAIMLGVRDAASARYKSVVAQGGDHHMHDDMNMQR